MSLLTEDERDRAVYEVFGVSVAPETCWSEPDGRLKLDNVIWLSLPSDNEAGLYFVASRVTIAAVRLDSFRIPSSWETASIWTVLIA